MKVLKYFIFFLIIVFGLPANAQDFIIGAKYGIGNVSYIRQSDDLKLEPSLSHRAVLVIEFSPFSSNLFVNSGIEYLSTNYMNAISIPLTLRLAFGKKIRPFLEGGSYYNCLSINKSKKYTTKNDIGAKAGLGLLIVPNKRLRLDAGYFWRFGFISGLEEKKSLPLEQVQYEQYKLREGSLELSMKYRF